MHFFQQTFTSASRGLKDGSQGFNTVECHQEIPDFVQQYTESLSYPQDGAKDRPAGDAIYCYAQVGPRDQEWVVLNRTVVTDPDHTGRSNYFSHTLTAPMAAVRSWLKELQEQHRDIPTPAGLMLAFGIAKVWRSKWDRIDPKWLGDADWIDPSQYFGSYAKVEEAVKESEGWKDPATGLLALDEQQVPKRLFWLWTGDPVVLMAYFHQAQVAIDPLKGRLDQRGLAGIKSPQTLELAWAHTFSTRLMPAQKSDAFTWLAIVPSESERAGGLRERFDPAAATVDAISRPDMAEHVRCPVGGLRNELVQAFNSSHDKFLQAITSFEGDTDGENQRLLGLIAQKKDELNNDSATLADHKQAVDYLLEQKVADVASRARDAAVLALNKSPLSLVPFNFPDRQPLYDEWLALEHVWNKLIGAEIGTEVSRDQIIQRYNDACERLEQYEVALKRQCKELEAPSAKVTQLANRLKQDALRLQTKGSLPAPTAFAAPSLSAPIPKPVEISRAEIPQPVVKQDRLRTVFLILAIAEVVVLAALGFDWVRRGAEIKKLNSDLAILNLRAQPQPVPAKEDDSTHEKKPDGGKDKMTQRDHSKASETGPEKVAATPGVPETAPVAAASAKPSQPKAAASKAPTSKTKEQADPGDEDSAAPVDKKAEVKKAGNAANGSNSDVKP